MTQGHVIALHCSGGSGSQWLPLKRMLPDRMQLWCPNFIGSTWTGHWSGDRAFTLADEAAPIISMIDALGRPVHLVGHSYGGAVALRVARERPDQIASMILYEPVALHVLKTAGEAGDAALRDVATISATIDRAILSGDHRNAASQFVEYWGGPGAWAALRDEAQAVVIHYMPKAPLDFRAVSFERVPLAAYRQFKFPVMLLQGQHAHEPMRLVARRLADLLRCCSLQTIDGAGHMGPLTHANAVASLMAALIAQADDHGVLENNAGRDRSAA